MSGRTARLRSISCGAVVLGTRMALAAAPDITLTCPAVSAQDAAQIEARIRANLLSAALRPTQVELQCDVESAATQVTGGGHTVLIRGSRGTQAVADTLLASADAALAAWASLDSAVAAFPPPSPPSPPAAAALPPTAQATTTAPALPAAALSTPAPPQPASRSKGQRASSPAPGGVWLSAGIRGELWHLGSGLGPQLGLERSLGAAWIAGEAGYLVALPSSPRFSGRELQLAGELGSQPSGAFGLRGALTVGVSVFNASPKSGLTASGGDTTSTLPFLGVNLSRPVTFAGMALSPVVGFRAFKRDRAVQIREASSSNEALALPALAFQVSLNFALNLGR